MDCHVLKRLDYPAYCIKVLDNNLVVLSGGGGTSKVGVPNSIELGLIDYKKNATSNGFVDPSTAASAISLAESTTHFETIHTYEPSDAIMKLATFSIETPISKSLVNGSTRQHNATKLMTSYLIAPINNTLEFLKMSPTVHRVENFDTVTSKRKDSEKSSSTRNRKSSHLDNNNNQGQNKNGSTSTTSTTKTTTAKSVKASAQLDLLFKLDQATSKLEFANGESNDDAFVIIPSSPAASDKNAGHIVPNKDLESINALTTCSILTSSNATPGISPSVILSVGTSKSNLTIWRITFDDEVKCQRLHIYANAHGEKEIDDLQMNVRSCSHELLSSSTATSQPKAGGRTRNAKQAKGLIENRPHVLSIGSDHKCSIWSVSGEFRKLLDLDYLKTLVDQNVRMRHARYDTTGKILYTTYIPRSRGGGKRGKSEMSSYVQRWRVMVALNKSFGSETIPKSTNECFFFRQDDQVTYCYKVEKTHRIRNTILTAMRCSKDGMQICCGDYEGRVILFDHEFNVLRNFKKQHSSVVTDLAFYHDSMQMYDSNKLILSLGIDRTLISYKYVDNNKLAKRNKLFESILNYINLNNNAAAVRNKTNFDDELDKKIKTDAFYSSLLGYFDCLSMDFFKYFCYGIFLIVCFCYFFTYLE